MGLPGEQILSKRIEFPQNLFYNKVWFLWNFYGTGAWREYLLLPRLSAIKKYGLPLPPADWIQTLWVVWGKERVTTVVTFFPLSPKSQPFLGRPRLHFGSLFLNGSLIPSKATDVGRNRRGEEGCSSGWVMSGQSDGSGSPKPTNLHRAWRDGGREDDVLWCLGG